MPVETFTKVPNKMIKELVKTNLSPYESRYVWALLRKTYGFHKSVDRITNSQFVKETGIRKEHITRTEKKLLEKKIINKNYRQIGFNTNYGMWPKGIVVADLGDIVADSGNQSLPIKVNTKEIKKTIQKKVSFSLKDRIVVLGAYKKGDKPYIPFYSDLPLRWVPAKQKWYVIKKDGEWSEYGDKENNIEWVTKT